MFHFDIQTECISHVWFSCFQECFQVEHIHRNQRKIVKKHTQCAPFLGCKLTTAEFDEILLSLMYLYGSNTGCFSTCCNFMLLVALFFKLNVDIKSKIINIYSSSFVITCFLPALSNLISLTRLRYVLLLLFLKERML